MIPIRLLYFRCDPHSTTPQIFKSTTNIFLLFFNHIFRWNVQFDGIVSGREQNWCYSGGTENTMHFDSHSTQILMSSRRNCRLIGGVCLVDLSTSVIFFKRDVEKFAEALSDRIHRPLCKFLPSRSRALLGGQPLATGNPSDRTSSNLGKLVFW